MAFEKRVFETPLGDVWLWGEASAFDGDGPVILTLLGFAAPLERMFPLQMALPEAATLFAHLPGNHSPALSACSVGAFAYAYGHVIATALAGRPLVVFGESLGGLVALAMEPPNLRRLVLDPPFRAPNNPLFVGQCRAFVRRQPEHAELAFALLGIGADALEPRDLTHLIGRPARVLVGAHDAPLKPGEAQSVVDDESRARLLAQPDVWLTTVNSAGHVLPGRAAALILRILREMVIDAARAAKDIAHRGDAPQESSD